ncbi:reticulon-like protein B9 [Tasmannia lanceolata]|uniref:reticulon-like protein B9 n=1 Tax=Tasmannia lanceolata TaxID=3420 RepID=UPI0040643526
MPTYYSDSDDQSSSSTVKLFGRQRPLHAVLGGGRFADVVLWRSRNLSAGLLAGITVTWALFEVLEYHLLTLLCYITIIAMLGVFLWSNGAALFDRAPPKIPEIILSERAFKEVASAFHARLSWFLSIFLDMACGKDIISFLLVISSLWIFSVIGSYCSSASLLYTCFLGIHIVPFLYERYEHDVDYLANKGYRELKKLYRKFEPQLLNKIPRGPVKDKERKFK